jgi:hypothetical protein
VCVGIGASMIPAGEGAAAWRRRFARSSMRPTPARAGLLLRLVPVADDESQYFVAEACAARRKARSYRLTVRPRHPAQPAGSSSPNLTPTQARCRTRTRSPPQGGGRLCARAGLGWQSVRLPPPKPKAVPPAVRRRSPPAARRVADSTVFAQQLSKDKSSKAILLDPMSRVVSTSAMAGGERERGQSNGNVQS